MSVNKSQISLVRFFVFNSNFGPKEGEEYKKIIFYHPHTAILDQQIRDVGLCEAVIQFTRTFDPIKPCEVLHTQKTKQFFLQAEEDYWIVMTVSVPFSTRGKEGQSFTEYHGDDVQHNVFQATLGHLYNMYKFFNGKLSITLNCDIDGLKKKVENFFIKFILNLKLHQLDISDVFSGIVFLPLDKLMFLRVKCLCNLLESTFPQIKHTAFMYNEHLVWSGWEQEDMQVLYIYLTGTLMPEFLETELRGGVMSPTRSAASPFIQPHYGRYVTGPPNVGDSSNLGKVPRVVIQPSNSNKPPEEYHLLVYRALNANMCLLVEGTYQLTFDFYKKLDAFLGPQLTTLASDIGEQYSRRPLSTSLQLTESPVKYAYFNGINLAQKSTIHVDTRRQANPTIPVEVLRLIGDLNSDLHRLDCSSEVMVRTVTDHWVVVKFSDQRELYVVLLQKNATLMDINEEVRRLCATQFTNLFLVD